MAEPSPTLALSGGRALASTTAQELTQSGFAIVADAFSREQMAGIADAYDEVMTFASGEDYKIGSTTSRLFDLVNRGGAFDDVYVHPLLLEACAHVIREPFKLSSLLARTVRPNVAAQELHADFPRDAHDAPMVGFILMVDRFHEANGATRFVRTSHNWPDTPSGRCLDPPQAEVLACGKAGSIIIFNGAVWHGHSANTTSQARRSIQGHFVRRAVASGMNFRDRMLPETLSRISPIAKYLLAV